MQSNCSVVRYANESFGLPWLSAKQSTGWSAISSSIKKSRPPSPSENENEFVAWVGVPCDIGLATSNIGDISLISFSSASLIVAIGLFIFIFAFRSSDVLHPLLIKLSDGEVSSSIKTSFSAAVRAANFWSFAKSLVFGAVESSHDVYSCVCETVVEAIIL